MSGTTRIFKYMGWEKDKCDRIRGGKIGKTEQEGQCGKK